MAIEHIRFIAGDVGMTADELSYALMDPPDGVQFKNGNIYVDGFKLRSILKDRGFVYKRGKWVRKES